MRSLFSVMKLPRIPETPQAKHLESLEQSVQALLTAAIALNPSTTDLSQDVLQRSLLDDCCRLLAAWREGLLSRIGGRGDLHQGKERQR
jgi:hypothetical protein